jgi:hypothetical protein
MTPQEEVLYKLNNVCTSLQELTDIGLREHSPQSVYISKEVYEELRNDSLFFPLDALNPIHVVDDMVGSYSNMKILMFQNI